MASYCKLAMLLRIFSKMAGNVTKLIPLGGVIQNMLHTKLEEEDWMKYIEVVKEVSFKF